VTDTERTGRANLREWLHAEGYGSLRQLARHLDIAESTIGGWLQGNRKPSLDLAVALEHLSNGLVPASSWADLHAVRDALARASLEKTPSEILAGSLRAEYRHEAMTLERATRLIAALDGYLDAREERARLAEEERTVATSHPAAQRRRSSIATKWTESVHELRRALMNVE
jgi:hypothetical protein